MSARQSRACTRELPRCSDPPNAVARWFRGGRRSGQLNIDDVFDNRAIKRSIEFDPGTFSLNPADPAWQALDRLEADNNLLPGPQQAFLRRYPATICRQVREDHVAHAAKRGPARRSQPYRVADRLTWNAERLGQGRKLSFSSGLTAMHQSGSPVSPLPACILQRLL